MKIMHRAIRELKDELQIWHLLVALILIGVTATTVIRGGTARYLTTCQQQAEDSAREQVVQQLETLPVNAVVEDQPDASNTASRYERAYRRCLQDVGIQQ